VGPPRRETDTIISIALGRRPRDKQRDCRATGRRMGYDRGANALPWRRRRYQQRTRGWTISRLRGLDRLAVVLAQPARS